MVAAGVYLVARTFPIFEAASETALAVVAWIGAVTALAAATVAVTQRDIKKVLAYSTISQLGFMMAALGGGSPDAGIFHLLHPRLVQGPALPRRRQRDPRHGRTRSVDRAQRPGRRMPVTAWTFAVGALALAGIPPFAGFWSKEEILAVAGRRRSR